MTTTARTALMAALALLGTLAQMHGVGLLLQDQMVLGWAATGAAVASCLPLLAWRRWPRLVFGACVVAGAVAVLLSSPLPLPLGPLTAGYLITSRRDELGLPQRWPAIAMVLAAGAAVAVTVDSGLPFAASAVHGMLPWAATWFAGERSRLRRLQLASLRDQLRESAEAAEQDRLLAIAQERTRIARDLHDSVGHAINVIAVRAAATGMRPGISPESVRADLVLIEEIARDTVAEIDQLVTALREADELDTPPGLGSLSTLLRHHREAGLVVDLSVTGGPHDLGRASDLAAYRIVQEALTNASRHGDGPVTVRLDYRAQELAIRACNPVRLGQEQTARAGHGLVGIGERATLVGGTVSHGVTEGIFVLDVRLPREVATP